jgi:hypothetical protein
MNSPQQQTVISDEYAEEFNKTHKMVGGEVIKKEESEWEGGIIPDCDICKKTFAEDGSNYNEKDGDLICDDCEDCLCCDNCDKHFVRDGEEHDLVHINEEGYIYCQDCLEDCDCEYCNEKKEEEKEKKDEKIQMNLDKEGWIEAGSGGFFVPTEELSFAEYYPKKLWKEAVENEDPLQIVVYHNGKKSELPEWESNITWKIVDLDDKIKTCDFNTSSDFALELTNIEWDEEEECDKCGFPDVSYCMSNGCEDVEEEEDIREKISNWLYDKTNNENDLIDFLIDECGVVIKPWKEEEDVEEYCECSFPTFIINDGIQSCSKCCKTDHYKSGIVDDHSEEE